MKGSDLVRVLPRLLLPLAAVCVHDQARAAVVWTATFENGDLSEWKPGVNPTKGERKNVEVLGEQVFTGMYAGKIVVHPDDTFTFNQNRVDIQHPSTLTDEGKEMWLSGHYMMPEDAKVRNEIGFFESNVSFQNVMDFWVDAKPGGGSTINFGVGFLGATKLWTADFTPGVWHQLAIHVLWSTDANKGLVDVWWDGQQVVTAHKAKTKADGNTLFYQTGLHRKDVGQFTETIYFDDFIEADTQAEVKIAAPMPAGGAGGMSAGGAAGMAGAAGSGGSASGGTATGGATAAGTGSGGAPSSAGMPSAAGSMTMSPSAGTSSAAPSDDAGGCACSSAHSARSGSRIWLAALALLGLWRRRRSAV